MATGTLSRGQDTLAKAMAITEKPAKTPWRRRARKSWVMEVTRPMAAMSDDPPAGFDPVLSAVDFSFKVACAGDFDCRTSNDCPAEAPAQPEIDYLAKDYASFRQLMLDR